MDTISKLKEIGATVYLSTAGGGAAAITDLCSPPGRSSVILGATFINDTDLFKKYIGVQEWSKYASYESAKALSVVSQEVGKNGLKHIGIGIASSLATNNERVGRVNVTNIVATGFNFEVSFTQEFKRVDGQMTERERYNQENQIQIHLNRVIELCYEILNVNDDILMVYSRGGDGYHVKILEQANIVENSINVYPGSFNPMHDGHLFLKETSEKITGNKTYLEISLLNFEKKRIDLNELTDRVGKIGQDILFSYDKTFVEKYQGLIKKYPHLKQINFVCGLDTWERIDRKDLEYFKTVGNVKFVVFARDKRWVDIWECQDFKSILYFDKILQEYDNPISSKQLRNMDIVFK